MTPQELIEKQVEKQRDTINLLVYSSLSDSYRIVLLKDLIRWNIKYAIVSLIDQEIERKKGMRINDYAKDIIFEFGKPQRVGYNQAVDEDIAHLTSLKELIK